MENIIKHYEKYITSINEVWKNRFTWKGLSGRDPKHTTSIVKFNEATKSFENIEPVYTVSELFTLIDNLSNDYITWVKTKGKTYSSSEYADMKRFFVGAIGEYFVTKLLNDVKCLMVYRDSRKTYERFDFSYVSPTISGKENDYGVDIYCVSNDVPSVMQVKFWNPYTREKLTPDIYNKLYTEGEGNEYIHHEDENNIFLFWLGSENTARTNVVGNNKNRDKHFVVIGRQSLMASIDDRNRIFWDNFYKSLKKL